MAAARSGLYPRGLVTPRCGAEPMACALAVANSDLPRGDAWHTSRFKLCGHPIPFELKCIDTFVFTSHGHITDEIGAF